MGLCVQERVVDGALGLFGRVPAGAPRPIQPRLKVLPRHKGAVGEGQGGY